MTFLVSFVVGNGLRAAILTLGNRLDGQPVAYIRSKKEPAAAPSRVWAELLPALSISIDNKMFSLNHLRGLDLVEEDCVEVTAGIARRSKERGCISLVTLLAQDKSISGQCRK